MHRPTTNPADRSASFALKNGVRVDGGFPASGNPGFGQRNWVTNKTILSGDIDNNDIADPSGVVTTTAHIAGSNSYHVVRADNVDSSAVLDGFIITAGKADGGAYYYAYDRGGGVFLNTSHPALRNLILSGNAASLGGGGMYNNNSSPTLTNVAFAGNAATNGGGGMYNNNSSPTLTNVTFSGNSADSGGGIANSNNSHPTLRNAILWSNIARTTAPSVYNAGQYNVPKIEYSDVEGGCPVNANCTNVIHADPLFADADGPDNIPGTLDDNLRLQPGSPAIDTGTNTGCPATDLDGLPRPADGDNDNIAICDMGAYETPANQPPVANAGPDQTVSAGQPVTLDGSGSADPDGHMPLSCAWSQSGGPSVTLSNANTATPSFTPAQTGVYAFTLVVTDSLGLASAPDSVVITVTNQPSANQPPVADAGPDQSVSVGQLVTLNGSGSSDPDNHLPLSYAWTQSGGPSVTLSNANTATPGFTPAQTGVYTFTLVVTDSLGLASAPDSVTVIVTVTPLRLYLPVVARQP